MKRTLLWGESPIVAAWVAKRIPDMDGGDFGKCVTGAVVDEDNNILGALVFSEFRGRDIQISVAADNRHWLTKKILHQIFWYPFIYLGCSRLTAYTSEKNISFQDMLIRFGFSKEGVMRQAFNSGDALLYGMLVSECKWIK